MWLGFKPKQSGDVDESEAEKAFRLLRDRKYYSINLDPTLSDGAFTATVPKTGQRYQRALEGRLLRHRNNVIRDGAAARMPVAFRVAPQGIPPLALPRPSTSTTEGQGPSFHSSPTPAPLLNPFSSSSHCPPPPRVGLPSAASAPDPSRLSRPPPAPLASSITDFFSSIPRTTREGKKKRVEVEGKEELKADAPPLSPQPKRVRSDVTSTTTPPHAAAPTPPQAAAPITQQSPEEELREKWGNGPANFDLLKATIGGDASRLLDLDLRPFMNFSFLHTSDRRAVVYASQLYVIDVVVVIAFLEGVKDGLEDATLRGHYIQVIVILRGWQRVGRTSGYLTYLGESISLSKRYHSFSAATGFSTHFHVTMRIFASAHPSAAIFIFAPFARGEPAASVKAKEQSLRFEKAIGEVLGLVFPLHFLSGQGLITNDARLGPRTSGAKVTKFSLLYTDDAALRLFAHRWYRTGFSIAHLVDWLVEWYDERGQVIEVDATSADNFIKKYLRANALRLEVAPELLTRCAASLRTIYGVDPSAVPRFPRDFNVLLDTLWDGGADNGKKLSCKHCSLCQRTILTAVTKHFNSTHKGHPIL